MSSSRVESSSAQTIYRSKLFIGVLLLKLLAGTFLASSFLRDSFTPFVSYYIASGFSNPWEFFAQRGELLAFPYHPLMLWILSVPRLLLAPFLSGDWNVVTPLHLFAMRIPLLLADLAVFAVLLAWFQEQSRRVLMLYWCSPIVFYICYFHGQLDAVPTALFAASLFLIKRESFLAAMLVLGLGLATKAHLLVALPFVFVYLLERISLSRVISLFSAAFATYFLLAAPYLASPGFRSMVLDNPQQKLVFSYALPIPGADILLYLCPAVLSLVFLRFCAYPKRNWDLTMLYLGIAFCSFVILVPPMQGWFLWTFPFLTFFFCREPKLNVSPLFFFSAAYLAYFFSLQSSDLFDAFALLLPSLAKLPAPSLYLAQLGIEPKLWQGLAFTVMQSSLFLLVAMIYRIGVRSNEIYRPRSKPALIGIAGDSGAGKDTLLGLMADLLGSHNLIALSGDDYHKWERNNENWKVFTHLDVRTNRLHQMLDHAIALKDGSSIVKVSYSHQTGEFTQPQELDPSKYVAISGLHSLVLEKMRETFDLKIFLDPDENLRQFWKLRRDVKERGHTKEAVLQSLRNREKDRSAHILPQRERADLIFSLKAGTKIDFEHLDKEPQLTLLASVSNHFDLEELSKALSQHAQINCSLVHDTLNSKQHMQVEGQISAVQIEKMAAVLIPNSAELLHPGASFAADLQGIMQLVFLIGLSTTLRWKKGSEMSRRFELNERDTWLSRQSA